MTPGPVSDAYDPEFGTMDHADNVVSSMTIALVKINEALGEKLEPIVAVAEGQAGRVVRVTFTERDLRMIRFSLNRSIADISG